MENVDLLKIIAGALTVVLAGAIAHKFAQDRDVKNAQRQRRVNALVDAYTVFVRAGIDGVMLRRNSDGVIENGAKPIEDAIGMIHLFGTNELSALASEYAKQVSSTNHGDSTNLVNALRKEIRANIGGEDLIEVPSYLRVSYKDEMPNK